MTARRVLIVDDEALIALVLGDMIEEMGFELAGTAATAAEAIELAEARQPDIVLMDVRLKGLRDGVEAAVEINKRRPTPLVFVTGSREPETMERIARAHPTEVLIKPVRLERLRSAIERVLGTAEGKA